MKLKSKKILISSLVIGFVAVGALVGGLTYWALTANNSAQTISQATIYIDENGEKQNTSEHDLTNIQTIQIIQIGYYQEKSNGPVRVVKMPKTIYQVPKVLPQQITSLKDMFRDCTVFNQNISGWDISNVTDMSYMFYGATNFSQDLSTWKLNPNVFSINFQ